MMAPDKELQLIAVGVGISSSTADFIAGKKERRTMEALLMSFIAMSEIGIFNTI